MHTGEAAARRAGGRRVGDPDPVTVERVTEEDGRRLRAARNRQRVADALLDLIHEGVDRPTAQQVADRSGVSIRSVFRLYDDMHDLHRAAIAAQARRVRAQYELPSRSGTLEQRIRRLVSSRSKLFESIGPVRRVGVGLASSSAGITQQLDLVNHYMRDQLADFFASELEAMPAASRRLMLNALDVSLSWETWDRLRTVQSLPERTARQVVAGTVEALLAQPPGAGLSR